jgi:phage baseplate assembly protein gpV
MEVSGHRHASAALPQGQNRNILKLVTVRGGAAGGGGVILDVVKKVIEAIATVGQATAHPFVIGNRNNW